MYVCICNAVTDRHIREAAAQGIDTLDGLTCATGAGACCGSCRPLALQVLDQARAEFDFGFAPAAA